MAKAHSTASGFTSTSASRAVFLQRGRDATLRFSDPVRFGLGVVASGAADALVPAHRPSCAWRPMKLDIGHLVLDGSALLGIEALVS